MKKLIFDYCWDLLQSYKDEGDHLGVYHKHQTLGWIEELPIEENKAKELLANWVHSSLKEHGKVQLYSCPDNGQIVIENPTEISLEDLKYIDEIIENTFYHGND